MCRLGNKTCLQTLKIVASILGLVVYTVYLFLNHFLPVDNNPLITFLLYLLLSSLVVISFGKEWGRKLIVVTTVLLAVYLILEAGQTGKFTSIPVALLLVVLVLYYILPRTKMMFRKQEAEAIAPMGPVRKILIIDDDRVLLKMLRVHLTNNGMDVVTADTGEKGLDLALRKEPDLIVLDVILPGVKGREVCAKIKEHKKTKDIPVIFLTSKDSPDDVQAEMKAGALMHLTKPVDPNQLLSVIKNILK